MKALKVKLSTGGVAMFRPDQFEALVKKSDGTIWLTTQSGKENQLDQAYGDRFFAYLEGGGSLLDLDEGDF
jgi:hypothetical protein